MKVLCEKAKEILSKESNVQVILTTQLMTYKSFQAMMEHNIE